MRKTAKLYESSKSILNDFDRGILPASSSVSIFKNGVVFDIGQMVARGERAETVYDTYFLQTDIAFSINRPFFFTEKAREERAQEVPRYMDEGKIHCVRLGSSAITLLRIGIPDRVEISPLSMSETRESMGAKDITVGLYFHSGTKREVRPVFRIYAGYGIQRPGPPIFDLSDYWAPMYKLDR